VRIAVPLFVTLSFLLMLEACAGLPGAPSPEIERIDARITGVRFDETRLAFDVAVHNPYPVAARTPRFQYDFEIEGSTFQSSSVSGSEYLPAGVTSVVVLPIHISYDDLFRSYPALSEESEVDYRLRVALGPSTMRPVEVPFYREGTFPVLRPPVVTASKVRLVDVSLREAMVVVDAEIENPNSIEIDISGLRYELGLSDMRVEVGNVPENETEIAPGKRVRIALSGGITPSEGLIELLISGVSDTPNLLVSGSIRTPYGSAVLPRL
jgi:LEA14-like dessication related protein